MEVTSITSQNLKQQVNKNVMLYHVFELNFYSCYLIHLYALDEDPNK